MRDTLDAAFAKAVGRIGGPGTQAIAMRDGQVFWSANAGKAIDDPATPDTDSTMFAYASFGKLVLGAYTLHLVENGLLALDKPISIYLGNDAPGSNVVTLRMLLAHTAGYNDLYEAPETAPLFEGGDQYDPNRRYTWEMLAPGIHEPVSPGTSYEYSNTGFCILARLLSRASGGDAALENGIKQFLQNAGEAGDQLTAQRSQSVYLRFAHGYYTHAGPSEGSLDYFTAYGATGIPTDLYGMPFGDGMFAGTAFGAARFLDALFVGGKLLKPATIMSMTTPTTQALAADDTYGMATYRTEVSQRVWQGHAGAFGGFTSMGGTDRTRGVTLMVVTNREGNASIAEVIWKELAKAYASVTP
ncbi:serine hydrolase domain-containing protein [Streptosporangium sp. NPDC002544]|uniref:serine hydrolase domain-containing protein n=1 Tax=Streptosporangium sp. NPDC002544 TaxID=3154538 RepID=UPI00332BFDFC